MYSRNHAYLWANSSWPQWRHDLVRLVEPTRHASYQLDGLTGRLQHVSQVQRDAMNLAALTDDIVKTSEIEGERLSVVSVRSSLARRLGVDIGALAPVDRNVEGVVEMVLDATGQCHLPLSKERLFGWHAALFPTGYSGIHPIQVGQWRDDADGPMQVVSGPIGRERVHFEGPPALTLETEVARFLHWLNEDTQEPALIKAGIGHLWFLDTLYRAVAAAHTALDGVLAKTGFWQHVAKVAMNERQTKMLNKLLDGFDGKLTTTKWAKISKCSTDTALRDINDLVAKHVLKKTMAGGRNASYELDWAWK